MEFLELLEAASPVLVAVATGIGGYWIANRKTSASSQDKFRDDLIKRVEKLEADNKLLTTEMKNLDRQFNELLRDHAILEIERDSLKQIVENYERRLFQWPFPSWVKRDDGLMLKVDDYYVEYFLKPHGATRKDYELRFDSDIHGEEVAAEYHKADSYVFNSGKPWIGLESYPKADGTLGKAPSAKWEIVTADGTRAIQGVILVTRKDIFT